MWERHSQGWLTHAGYEEIGGVEGALTRHADQVYGSLAESEQAAARRVFAQLGYEAATVRDIIRGTDLASGTFYNYFRSKEEVFEALADDGARRFRPILRAARESARSFEDYLGGAFRAYFHFIAEGAHLIHELLRLRPHPQVAVERAPAHLNRHVVSEVVLGLRISVVRPSS